VTPCCYSAPISRGGNSTGPRQDHSSRYRLDPCRPAPSVNLGVVGNIKDTLQALLPRVAQREDAAFLNSMWNVTRRRSKRRRAEPRRAARQIPGQYLTSIINRLANEDALFAADDGTPLVWMLRMVEANGKRRMFGSLLHGTMATSIGNAIGLQQAQPGRQVIALAGDGGFSMLLGDVLTTIQESCRSRSRFTTTVNWDSWSSSRRRRIVTVYTDLVNPDFGKVAEAMGLWGKTVNKAEDLEGAVAEWLGQPGPALLNVKVEPMELVMPRSRHPKPFTGWPCIQSRPSCMESG